MRFMRLRSGSMAGLAVTTLAYALGCNGAPDPNGDRTAKAAATVQNGTAFVPTSSGSPSVTAAAPVAPSAPSTYLYAANMRDGTVSTFIVDPATGKVSKTGQAAVAGQGTHGLAVSPAGDAVYAANLVSNDVAVLGFDYATGQVTSATAPVMAGGNPSTIALDKSGSFAYTTALGAGLQQWKVDKATHALTAVGQPIPCGTNPAYCTVWGSNLYVANSGSNDVSVFSLDAGDGTLVQVIGSPFAAGTSPAALAVSPSGSYLYCANLGSNDVTVFNVKLGALTKVATVPVGTQPTSIAIDPTGKLALVANYGSENIQVFKVDAAAGTLTSASTLDAKGTGVVGVAFDVSGKYAFAAMQTAGTVGSFTVDLAGGRITQVGGGVASGGGPVWVSASPR